MNCDACSTFAKERPYRGDACRGACFGEVTSENDASPQETFAKRTRTWVARRVAVVHHRPSDGSGAWSARTSGAALFPEDEYVGREIHLTPATHATIDNASMTLVPAPMATGDRHTEHFFTDGHFVIGEVEAFIEPCEASRHRSRLRCAVVLRFVRWALCTRPLLHYVDATRCAPSLTPDRMATAICDMRLALSHAKLHSPLAAGPDEKYQWWSDLYVVLFVATRARIAALLAPSVLHTYSTPPIAVSLCHQCADRLDAVPILATPFTLSGDGAALMLPDARPQDAARRPRQHHTHTIGLLAHVAMCTRR